MSNIALQFAAQNDALSRAICAFDHGWPSHVDAVMPGGRLLGARADGGVKLRTANYARFARVLRVAIPAADDVSARFYAFLNAQLGKPYDFEAIAAFALDRDWRKPDSWFCSELVAAALQAAGWFAHPLATASNRITPSDLLLVLSPFVTVGQPTENP